jgi:hypothetical protein
MGFPNDALVYPTFDLALNAVAGESRGSDVNTIYLVAGDTYSGRASLMGILNLEIRSYMPPFMFTDPPTLILTGNLVNISNSFSLVQITLISSSNRYNDTCIEVQSPVTAKITIVDSWVDCPVVLFGQIDFKATNHTKLPILAIAITNGTVHLEDMRFLTELKMALKESTWVAKRCHFWGLFDMLAIEQAHIEFHNTRFEDRAIFKTLAEKVNAEAITMVFGNNFFNQSLQVTGVAWSAKVYNNSILKYYDNYMLTPIVGSTSRSLAHWEPSLVFAAICDARIEVTGNIFLNGTFYIDMPYSESTHIFCSAVSNPYSMKIFGNQFLKPPGASSMKFDSYGAYRNNMRYAPAIAVMGPYSPFVPSKTVKMVPFEAHGNWWDDTFGPSLCCLLSGQGSFPTLFVDPSHWCLDPNCRFFSSEIRITAECTMQGCPQFLAPASKSLIILFAIIGILSSLAGITYSIISQRMHFTAEKMQHTGVEESLVRASKLFLIGLSGSILGCISTGIVLAMCIASNHTSLLRPLQAVLYPQTLNAGYTIAFLSGVQLIFNSIIFLLVLMRRKCPRVLKFALRLFWVWCAISVCILAINFISWIPSLYHSNQPITTDTLRATGVYVWLLSSPLNYLMFLAYMMFLLALYGAMIPGRLLHNHICHPEYVKITTTLETSMLAKVVKMTRLETRALWTRWVSVFALFMATTQLGLQITVFVIPTIYYVGRDELRAAFTPVGLFRLSFGVSAGFTLVGIGGLIGAIWASRRIRPAGHYTVLSLLLTVAMVGTVDMLTKYYSVFSIINAVQSANITWAIVNTVFSGLCFLSFLASFFLLRSIRSSILKELAKQARMDINAHLDNAWYQTSTINDPIATTSSRSQSSRISASHTLLGDDFEAEGSEPDDAPHSPNNERLPLLSPSPDE